MVKHVAAVLLLVLAGLWLPAGAAQASPHHHMTTTVADGEAGYVLEADCPDHPAPLGDADCCAMGCSASALPAMDGPPQACQPNRRGQLPGPIQTALGLGPKSLFRPPR